MPARLHSMFSTAEQRHSHLAFWNRADLFQNLHLARGPIAKAKLLQERFSTLSAREGEYIVKILTGDLRIGLREGLVEESIARAFDVPLRNSKTGQHVVR